MLIECKGLGDGSGAVGMIAGEHRDVANAVRPDQLQRLSRGFPQWIGDGDCAEQDALDGHEHDRLAVTAERRRVWHRHGT